MKLRTIINILTLTLATFSVTAQVSPVKRLDMKPTFSRFARGYVENSINAWQKKGEYEKTSDYRARIENERDAMIKNFTDEARRKFIERGQPADLKSELTLGEYNADEEGFLLNHPVYGQMFISVPLKDAPKFKQEWDKTVALPNFVIENDLLALAGIEFIPNRGKSKKRYLCTNNIDPTLLAINDIQFNFEPVEIEPENVGSSKKRTQQNIKTPVASRSDIDSNIPRGKDINPDLFAVVIANENYKRESLVEYASNDGAVFSKYLNTTLGVPAENIHTVHDATLNEIRGELDWLKSVGEAYNGEASLIVYYAGHGIPDEKDRTGYLLPVDGYGTNVSTGMPLNEFSRQLGQIPSRLTLIFLDACFSGAVRDGGMLAQARGVTMKVKKPNMVNGNMIVFSASADDQTAAKYDQEQHGMFTYYLLKKFQETQGKLTLGDLADSVQKDVSRQSVVTNGKPQTPTVHVSPSLAETWRSLRLNSQKK